MELLKLLLFISVLDIPFCRSESPMPFTLISPKNVILENGSVLTISLKTYAPATMIAVTDQSGSSVYSHSQSSPAEFQITLGNIVKDQTYKIKGTVTGIEISQDVKVQIFQPARILWSSPKPFILDPVSGTNFSVTCPVSGTVPITTEWVKSESGETMVSATATLSLRNGEHTEAGNYTCNATNHINGKTYSDAKTITIKEPPGAPTIVKTDYNECWNGANITWFPSDFSVGYVHRFLLMYDMNGTKTETSRNITAQDVRDVTETFQSLQPLQNYTVSITVCENICYSSTTVQTRFTAGVTRPPSVNARISQSPTNRQCMVSWPPLDTSFKIIHYEIAVRVNFLYPTHADDPQNFENLVPGKGLNRNAFEMKPNRVYEVTIIPENCAGTGPSIAIGTCKRGRKEPDSVAAPDVDNAKIVDGKASIILHAASEENGAISCYFLIGIGADLVQNSGTTEKFTMARLNQLMDSTRSEMKSNSGKEYIAAAFSRNFFGSSMEKKFVLGDNSTTICNINETVQTQVASIMERMLNGSETQSTSTTKVSVYGTVNNSSTTIPMTTSTNEPIPTTSKNIMKYFGRNLPLDDMSTYSFYVVTVTPTFTGYLFQQSKPIVLSLKFNWPLIVLFPCIMVLAIITVILVVILCKRKKRKEKLLEPGFNGETTPNDIGRGGSVADGNGARDRLSHHVGEYTNQCSSDGYLDDKELNIPEQKMNEQKVSEAKYENLRPMSTSSARQEPASSHDSVYEIMTVSSSDVNTQQGEGENIYLQPMTKQKQGEATYANIMPSEDTMTPSTESAYANI